jgi:hypothetical protein
MISVSAALQAALEGSRYTSARLAKLPGGLYLTDWKKDLPFELDTYQSNGVLLKVGTASRAPGFALGTYSVQLSAVNQSVLTTFLTGNLRGAEGVVSRVFLNANGAIIGNEALIDFKGTLDTWAFSERNGSAVIDVKLTTRWASRRLVSGRFTNSDSQEAIYPGDKFFDMAHEERSAIGWGS